MVRQTQAEALEEKNQLLRESMDMIEQAVEDWKAMPLKEHFELASMVEALSRVEAAIQYEKKLLAELESGGPTDKEKPRLLGQGQIKTKLFPV